MTRFLFVLSLAVLGLFLGSSTARAEKVLCQQSSFWVGDYLTITEAGSCPAESVVDLEDLPGLRPEPQTPKVECKLEDWVGTAKDGYAYCQENGNRYCVAQVVGPAGLMMGCQKPFQRRPHHTICCG